MQGNGITYFYAYNIAMVLGNYHANNEFAYFVEEDAIRRGGMRANATIFFQYYFLKLNDQY